MGTVRRDDAINGQRTTAAMACVRSTAANARLWEPCVSKRGLVAQWVECRAEKDIIAERSTART